MVYMHDSSWLWGEIICYHISGLADTEDDTGFSFINLCSGHGFCDLNLMLGFLLPVIIYGLFYISYS